MSLHLRLHLIRQLPGVVTIVKIGTKIQALKIKHHKDKRKTK